MELTLSLSDERIAGDVSALREFSALELAVALYAKGVLPVGKAMELAGMTRREFMQCVQSRGVCKPFDEAEIERELTR